MNFQDEKIVRQLAREIEIQAKGRRFTFMEVCGTHTMAMYRHGLKSLLPENVKLISGPGCPVCVTANSFIDWAVTVSRLRGVIICTFGDLMRVPGSHFSLENQKSVGADIRILYSPMDVLAIATNNPGKQVVFLGIGFETTAPTVAASILAAHQRKLENLTVLSAHKTMPHAMAVLAQNPELSLDGFICPGHVSTIIGSAPYQFLADQFGLACVIAGFEPVDMMQSILMLVKQKIAERPAVEIQYRRVVKPEGNPRALSMIERVFVPVPVEWRGLGTIPTSGLDLSAEWQAFNARKRIPVDVPPSVQPKGCICGSVLMGMKTPDQCPLFARTCTPENPIGACMVSSEGSCAAFYKYARFC